MTDGFSEQFNGQARNWDMIGLREIFARIAHLPPARIIDELNHTAAEWMNATAQKR